MNISEKVELILKHDPKSRSSDKRLQIIFMQKMGMNLTPEQVETFYSLPALETLRRTRQAIQEQGKYPASVEVEAERKAKQVFMKRGGYKNPESIIESPIQKLWPDAEVTTEADPFPVAKPKYVPLPWDQS